MTAPNTFGVAFVLGGRQGPRRQRPDPARTSRNVRRGRAAGDVAPPGNSLHRSGHTPALGLRAGWEVLVSIADRTPQGDRLMWPTAPQDYRRRFDDERRRPDHPRPPGTACPGRLGPAGSPL